MKMLAAKIIVGLFLLSLVASMVIVIAQAPLDFLVIVGGIAAIGTVIWAFGTVMDR